MKRRILSCLLALIMTLSLLPMNALAANMGWTMTVTVFGDTYYGKDGTKSTTNKYSKYASLDNSKEHDFGYEFQWDSTAGGNVYEGGWQLCITVDGKVVERTTAYIYSRNLEGAKDSWTTPSSSHTGTSTFSLHLYLSNYPKGNYEKQTAYSLIYDKNTTDTVTNMPANQTTTVAADGVQFTVSDKIPVRDGYTFKGWQTSDGTKVGAKVGVTKAEPSITIYAIWEANAPIDPPTDYPTIDDETISASGFYFKCVKDTAHGEKWIELRSHSDAYSIDHDIKTKADPDGSERAYFEVKVTDVAAYLPDYNAVYGDHTICDGEPSELTLTFWLIDKVGDAPYWSQWEAQYVNVECETKSELPPIPGKEENTIGGSGFDFVCVTEDATHNKQLQMTLRDHPEAYTVGTEIKTKTDPRGGERAYFEVTVTDVAAYLPTYNYFYGNHKICDGQPNTLTLTFWLLDSGRWGQWGSRTVDPYVKVECVKIPDAPTADEVKAALGNVTVRCINPTTGTQDCTDKSFWAAGGNSVGEPVKVSDTQYTVSIGAAAFVNAFDKTGKHNLYSDETLTWVLNYEDGEWVGTPQAEGVDDTILVTHAPEKYQEVSKMGYDLDGEPTGIKATCTTGGHGPITYGLSTAFVYYDTDVVSVAYDAESKGYIATLKVDHYVKSIGDDCNEERAKNELDARNHKLTSAYDTVQWKLSVAGYDKETGKYVWASEPVAEKDAAITVSHQLRVTFKPENGNSDFSNLVYDGETVAEEPVVTKDGYKFLGWYLGEEKFNFATPITEDITLVAKWEVAPHTIYAYANLLSYFAPLSTNEFDTPITLNNATLSRLGLGSYNSKGYVSIGTLSGYNNMPLTADEYMAYYDDEELADVVKELKTKLVLEQGVSAETAAQIVWTVLFSAKSEILEAGYPTTDADGYQLSGNLNLATVMFLPGGNNVQNVPANYTYDDVIDIYDFYLPGETLTLPAAPTRSGYDFLGWSEEILPAEGEDGGDIDISLLANPDGDADIDVDELYQPGDEYAVTENGVVFTAQWKESKQVVNVVIYRNGNFDESYKTVSLGTMAKGTVIDLTKLDIADYYTGTGAGYEFHGWYNDGAWNEYKKNPDRAGLSEVTVNGWTNLKCMVYDYETIVVKAVYNNDKDNATELFRGKALHGSNVLDYLASQNIELDKDGYTHDQWFNWDWYTAWDGDANRIGANTTVNGWTNLYVKYNTIYLDVTFDLNGGNVGGDTSNVVVPVAWGSTVTAPNAVRKTGDKSGYNYDYSLLGWYLDGAAFDLTTPITESITLKAEWRPPYKLTSIGMIKSGSFVGHCTTDAGHKDFCGGAVNGLAVKPYGATPELENGVWTIKASFNAATTLSTQWKNTGLKTYWEGVKHEWTGEGTTAYVKLAWNPAAEEWYPTEELTYNRTTGNYDTVKVLEDNIFYINAKCVTEPAAPTDKVVQALKVMGLDSTANNKFVKGSIKLIAGTYTIGEVTGTRKDGFTCVITINDMQKYVDAVNAAKGETYVLDADKTADPFTITLKVAANSTDLSKAAWKEDQTGYTNQEKNNGKAFYLTREYTVTFKPENGEADFTQTVIYGKTATKPTTPSKSGYTFAGWYTEDHKVFDFNTAIYGNLTLTAAWAPSGATAFVENFLTIDCVGCNLGSKLGHAHGAKTYEFLDRAFSVSKDTFQWNEELGTYTVELYNKSLKLNPYLGSIANWVGFDENPGEKLPHQMVGGDRNFYLLCAQAANGQWMAVGYADWKQGGKHDAFTMMPNGVKIDVECGTPELPTLVTDSNMIWTRDETNTRQYKKTSVLDGTWTILNDTFKRDEKTGTFYVTIQVAKDQLTKYIDNAAASGKWGDGYLLNEEKTEDENATPFQFVMKFNLDTSKDASEAYKSTYVKRNKTYSNWSWDKTTVSGSVKNNGYTVWATKEYNVTFETDGGVPVPAPQVVRWGKYATKPAEIPVKGDSWVFNGWYTDETGAVEFDFDKTAIKANTTIYAGYDSVYEIHYFKQLADGSYEEDTASFVRGFAKEGAVINAPEKDYGTHFLLNTEKSNMSGSVIKATVDNEGKVNCLVLNVYYDRDMHTVTFDTQGGTKIDPVTVRCGNPVAQPITPSKAGYYFSGWFLNGSKYNFSTPVTSDITITAKFTKYAPTNPTQPTVEEKDLAFNTTDHFAYVNGYPDGTVQPEGNITRAEVAAILYRVMDAKCVEKYATDKNTFADVDAFKWYNTYISTLANAGVIVDSANGYFRPDEAITRAELAAMIAQFAKVDSTKSVSFNDVLANHWASKEIAIAAEMGWINGYPDGSFRPDATITRAEMITMINRALNRVPSAEDHLLAEMVTFPDCQSGQWYYLAVQEATNGHTYNRVGTAGDEQWIALIK